MPKGVFSAIHNMFIFCGAQIAGIVNAGYLVNVGPAAYSDLSVGRRKNLLVHELTHVWQGANSNSSMTYVTNSVMSQCKSNFGPGARTSAYNYRPGSNWSAYNAEQQASIVEDWFVAGKLESGPLWPYVRDRVRRRIV